MNKKQAIQILKRHRPCNHSNYELVGFENQKARCYDCGDYFNPERMERIQKSYDEFDQVISYLEENLEEPEVLATDVKLGTVYTAATGESFKVFAYHPESNKHIILTHVKDPDPGSFKHIWIRSIDDIAFCLPDDCWIEK